MYKNTLWLILKFKSRKHFAENIFFIALSQQKEDHPFGWSFFLPITKTGFFITASGSRLAAAEAVGEQEKTPRCGVFYRDTPPSKECAAPSVRRREQTTMRPGRAMKNPTCATTLSDRNRCRSQNPGSHAASGVFHAIFQS